MMYKVIKNFISKVDNSEILLSTVNNKKWLDSNITSSNNNYRKSKVIHNIDSKVRVLFETELNNLYKDIIKELNIKEFDISKIEMQITSSNDGDFYKPHPDSDYYNAKGDISKRRLTFVYYYFYVPKLFDGGSLKIYEFEGPDRKKYDKKLFEKIIPENNMIIFFESDYWHEIEKINCIPKIENSRFTINGWIQ